MRKPGTINLKHEKEKEYKRKLYQSVRASRQKFEPGKRKKKRKLCKTEKTTTLNWKQKKGKRKENFEFRLHIGISVKKMFLNCERSSVD